MATPSGGFDGVFCLVFYSLVNVALIGADFELAAYGTYIQTD